MASVAELNLAALAAARRRQSELTKPTGALGQLEYVACWFAARQGRAIPRVLKPAITVFAADHGVTAQGVSAYPAEVTAQMLTNLAGGGAAINILARQIGASVTVVDVGVVRDSPGTNRVVRSRIRPGTADISLGPAMQPEEAERALAVGAERADADIAAGSNLLIAGDMGIGNTTPSACLICAFTRSTPGETVGRGTGLDDSGRRRKVQVVERVLARAGERRPKNGIEWLAEIGGLEIAAIAGYYLQAARRGVPALLDGFISAAAALAARAIEPRVLDWLLASHVSAEQGHRAALRDLELNPLIDLEMRLGEGTGAALCVPLIQAALALHAGMATFASAGVANRPGAA